MLPDILEPVEFYSAITVYLNRVDPTWDDGWRHHLAAEASRLHAALASMGAALRPGGLLYIRLRDFDALRRDRPCYEFKAERVLPQGRLLRLEDWEYEGETHVVDAWVFLREDRRWPGPDAEQDYRWQTTVFRYRRRALGRAELQRLLARAGFGRITALTAAPHHWQPLELLAWPREDMLDGGTRRLRQPDAATDGDG